MKHLISLAAAALLAFAGSALAGEGIVYAIEESDGSAWLYSIDRDSGASTPIGDTGFASVDAIDFDGSDTLYAVARRASDGQLVLATIDTDSGVGAEAFEIDVIDGVLGMTYKDSTRRLVVWDDQGELRSINPIDGTVSSRCAPEPFPCVDRLGTDGGGLAFVPNGPRYAWRGFFLEDLGPPWRALAAFKVESGYFIHSAHGMDCDPDTGIIHANVLISDWFSPSSYDAYVTIDPAWIVAKVATVVRVDTGVRALAVRPNRAPVISSGPVATPERAPLADPTVQFAASADDLDGNDVTYEWDFGDGSTATGNQVTHTFAASGEYVVVVTASDGSLESTDSIDFVVNSPPSVETLVATPWGVAPGADVELDVVVGDPDGDPVTVTWDFGDGASASGPSPVHAFANPDVYTPTVTLDDGLDTTTGSVMVVVGQPAAKPKLRGKLNFKRPNKDRASLVCGTVLPDGFVPDGKTLEVRIGGLSHAFVLDRKGKAKDDAGSVSLKFKKRKGYWRVSVALKKGDFRAAWSGDGLSNATQKKTAVSMRTIVLVDGLPCFATTDQLYTAKQDKWGRLK